MFRASNNKVNPSLKEKQQKKNKREKQVKRQAILRAQEEDRKKRAEEFAFLNSKFKLGNLYRVEKRLFSTFTKGTIFLLVSVRQDRLTYCFEVILGEDVGELHLTFEIAMSCLKEIDINSELE